jgi:ATP-dependent protease HslVU (ClpYQ) peptidase subunit
MTCIVGIGKNGVSWLGGDSAATGGDLSKRIIGESKVTVKNNIAFGIAGSPKILNAIMNTRNFDHVKLSKNHDDNMHHEILPLIKKTLADFDCITNETFEGGIIVGFKGKIFRVESNFQVFTCKTNFDSIGSGSDIAMGTLHATQTVNNSKKRIMMALEASADNNAGVCAPFSVVSVK